jgi:hypothetical protein
MAYGTRVHRESLHEDFENLYQKPPLRGVVESPLGTGLAGTYVKPNRRKSGRKGVKLPTADSEGRGADPFAERALGGDCAGGRGGFIRAKRFRIPPATVLALVFPGVDLQVSAVKIVVAAGQLSSLALGTNAGDDDRGGHDSMIMAIRSRGEQGVNRIQISQISNNFKLANRERENLFFPDSESSGSTLFEN